MSLAGQVAITLIGLRWLALDPEALALFWAGLLDAPRQDDTVVLPGYALRFVRTDRPKTVQGRIHLDLTSDSPDDQRERVATAVRLGGRHADVGQGADADDVVLADPEGNELCVIPPGSAFLAGTGRVGAVNCDGTHALGVFWSRVLGWPLVWDEGEETAVQSPDGGSKVTWSGAPLMARDSPDRICLEVAVEGPWDLARLVELGATPVGVGRYLDPDGNDLVVSSP